MGRLLAGLALIALCAGLVWLWSGSERGAGARTARPATPAESSPAPAARLEPAARVREEPVAETRAPEAVREELARSADQDRSSRAGAREADLVVEVVDPAGAPRAGILLRLAPEQARDEGTSVPDPRSSDARGRVVFDGLRARLLGASEAWTLHTDLPFEEPPSLRLDAGALAAPIVRFVLPPGAALDVVVRELDGAHAPGGSKLRLQLVKPEERLEPDLTGPEWKQALVEGAAHFPWVELGRDWELAAWRPKGAEPTRLRARGPAVLGQGVELALVLGSDHPVVSFRVLDPSGNPLAQAELELARGSIFGSLDKSTLTTDANGRFTLDGTVTFFEGGGFSITYRAPLGEAWMGRASLPEDPATGWNDGGDLRLEPEPLLVAGRVVDERGAPVVEADVQVGEEQNWVFGEAQTVRGKSDARGKFELRGLWTEETFQVHAEAAGERSQDVEVRQGAEGVVLVLTPRFTLSGSLQLDPRVDPGAIRFAREAPSGERADLERQSQQGFVSVLADPLGIERRQEAPDRFWLAPTEGGVFDFVVLLENVELMRLEGLVVQSDLDLGPLDLRGKVNVCEIELVGEGDLADLAGEYSWWPSGSDEHRQGSFNGPLVSIASAQSPLDVELRPRGYRSALLEKVDGRRQHYLVAPLRVRLVVRTSGTLPPPPYRFGCGLCQDGNLVGQPDGPWWFTPERSEIRCLVASPGQLEVRWHLERKVEGESFGGAIGSHVLEEHWTTIEVLDVPGEQLFELALDGAALDELTRSPPW